MYVIVLCGVVRVNCKSTFWNLNGLGLLLDLLEIHLEAPDVGLELEVLNVQAIINLLDLRLELAQLFYGRGLALQGLQLGLNRLDLLGVIADLFDRFSGNMSRYCC